MMPNVSVNPAASRNISRPSCTPFSIWSSRYSIPRHIPANETGARCRAPVIAERAGSLHRALLIVRILAVLHGRGDGLHRHHAFGILDRFLDVEVLDRELVGVVLEAPAQRLEVGLLHLGAD